MNKQFGAAALLSGTAIGSGMISLPIVLAKFGLINTCYIMLFFSGLTYLTALIRSDLNLNSEAGATLGTLGNFLKNPVLGRIGDLFLVLLHFALMAAYLPGFASIVCSLIGSPSSHVMVMVTSACGVSMLFLFATDLIVHINKYIFIALFGTFLFLVICLLFRTSIEIIPEKAPNLQLQDWTTLVPIIFTSFGFQGSIHSMTKYCENDRKLIKGACFWGSLIPAVVYIVWTGAILLVVANTDSSFAQKMITDKGIDVGELIAVLSKAASSWSIQLIVWVVSIFAILTSVIGVGLALLDLLQQNQKLSAPKWLKVSLVVWAPAAVSIFVPNAFIRILNVAGIILATIAIIIPVVFSFQMPGQKKNKIKRLLKHKEIIAGVFICGIAIVILGLMDLWV